MTFLKPLVGGIVAALALTACATDHLTQYARGQTAYNAALAFVVENRTTCVDDPADPLCVIDDAVYPQALAAAESASALLGEAYAAALAGDDDEVARTLTLFQAALIELQGYLIDGGGDGGSV